MSSIPRSADPLRPLGVYNVKQVGGARGDGTTDDTAAVQETIDVCQSEGGGTVLYPDGTFLINTMQSANINWFAGIVVSGDNVTFRGVGDASVLKCTIPNANVKSLLAINGASKPAGWANWGTYNVEDVTKAPLYNLVGSYVAGDRAVTVDTSLHAANFAPGDLIYIRTGQLLAPTLTEPDAEVNEVLSVSGATISLVYPLAKPYAQEYYITGTTGKTSTNTTANPAPYGVVKVTDRWVKNFAIESLRFDSTVHSTFLRQVLGIKYTNVNSRNGRGFVSGGEWSRAQFVNCIGLNTDATYQSYNFAPATGCSDIYCANVTLASVGFAYLHIHEGVSRFRWLGGAILNAGNGDTTRHAVDIASRGYDIGIDGASIINGGSDPNDGVVFIQGSGAGGSPRGVDGGGYVRNCTLYNRVASKGIFVGQNAFGWRFDNNDNTGAITGDTITVSGRLNLQDARRTYGINSITSTAQVSNMPRVGTTFASAAALTLGTLYLTTIELPANLRLTKIAFLAGVVALTPGTSGNQWFCLLDGSRNFLCITSDDGITPWGVNGLKPLPVASVAGGTTGAATSYTTPYAGSYYGGILVAQSGGTPIAPQLTGNASSVAPNQLAPIIAGPSSSTYTAAPDISGAVVTAGAIDATSARHIVYVHVE